MPDTRELVELLARVKAATDTVDLPDAIALWCMSSNCRLVEHRSGERGVDGYWTYTLLVEDASGRKVVIVPEWQLPDRSVDAALALVERMLPGWDYGLDRDSGKYYGTIDQPLGTAAPVHFQAEAVTAPLAILAALLSAIITKSKPS